MSKHRCENCGARISVAGNVKEFKCDFCDSSIPNPDYQAPKTPPKLPPRRTTPGNPATTRQSGAPPAAPRRRRHRALLGSIFAIAIFFTFSIAFCCCSGFLPVLDRENNDNNPVTSRSDDRSTNRRRNEEEAEKIIAAVLQRIENDGRILDDADGNQVTSTLTTDAWRRNFQYEQVSERSFLIRSSGEDGNFFTSDDYTKRQLVDQKFASAAYLLANDEREADIFLVGPGFYRQAGALRWYAQHSENYSPERMVEISLRAVEICGRNRGPDSEDLFADFLRNVTSDHDENSAGATVNPTRADRQTTNSAIFSAVSEACDARRRYALLPQLVEILGARNERERVEGFLNHADEETGRTAKRFLTQWNYSEEQLVQICLRDLQQPNLQKSALSRLGRLPPRGAEDVAIGRRILNSLLSVEKHGNIHRDKLKQLLARFAGQQLVPELIRCFESSLAYDKEYALALIATRDPRALQTLSSVLAEPGAKSGRAAQALETSGPFAEPFIWPVLESGSGYYQQRGCNILKSIGSRESILHLSPLLNSPDAEVRQAAAAAIQAIEQAKRAPEKLPPAAPPATDDK